MLKKLLIYCYVIVLSGMCLCGCGESTNNENTTSTSNVQIDNSITTDGKSDKETSATKDDSTEKTTQEETTTEKPHEWNEGEITLDATCKEDGIMTFTCLVCEEKREESIPKTTEHTWNEGVITLEANCTFEGEKTYTCEICEETRNEIVEKNDSHKWDSGKIIVQAECNSEGKKQYSCTLCEVTKEESIAATNEHLYGEGIIKVKPTCGTEGIKEYTCSKCNNVKKETLKPEGTHSLDKGRVTKAATVLSEGIYTYTCTICYSESNEVIPKLVDDKTTVYSTDKVLYLGEIPVYGIVRIDKEYYIPLECYRDIALFNENGCWVTEYDTYFKLKLMSSYEKEIHYVNSVYSVPNNKIMGSANETNKYLMVESEKIETKIWEMNGENQLVRLKDIGAVEKGNDFYIDYKMDDSYVLVPEKDLVGEILPTLQRGTVKETAKAIHDYIVNRITYDPRVSMPSWATDALLAEVDAIFNKVEAEYSVKNNITLASNYGVCHHYADLYREMCNRIGIPCVVDTGTAGGEGHAWNKVYIDGKWELVDCTYDDPVSKTPTYRDKYFMISPDNMAKDHYWVGDDYPDIGEYDESWNDLDVNNITSKEMYRKCLVAQLMQKKGSFSLKPATSGAYGGHAIMFAGKYNFDWYSMSGSYNSTTGAYEYKVLYW